MKKLKFLLVNPYITDFAAYDLWSRPLGLLNVGAQLLKNDMEVSFIDLMSRELYGKKDKYYTTGKYHKVEIDLPESFRAWHLEQLVDRKYFRYGIPLKMFLDFLEKIDEPDVILMTSIMTYWYPGLFFTAKILRERFPEAKIVLGGIYAFLCKKHAESSGLFDYVVTEKKLEDVIQKISKIFELNLKYFPDISPAYDLYGYKLKHFALFSSIGCPFRCSYCASHIMYEKFEQMLPGTFVRIFGEARKFANSGEFAFYDDALLINSARHIKPILSLVEKYSCSLNIHLPNAIHPKYIDRELAILFKESGVKTIRLGFESIDEKLIKKSSNKITISDIVRGVGFLKDVGYTHNEIGAYVLFGVPGTKLDEVIKSAKFINSLGVKIFISNFSPIPFTRDYYEHLKDFPILGKDPVFQNNTLTMILKSKEYKTLKKEVKNLNDSLH